MRHLDWASQWPLWMQNNKNKVKRIRTQLWYIYTKSECENSQCQSAMQLIMVPDQGWFRLKAIFENMFEVLWYLKSSWGLSVPQSLLRSLSTSIPRGLSALQSPLRSLSTLIPLTYLPLQNLVLVIVSVWSPGGEIHNLRLNSGGVSSKGLGFSLCGGLPMHSYFVDPNS